MQAVFQKIPSFTKMGRQEVKLKKLLYKKEIDSIQNRNSHFQRVSFLPRFPTTIHPNLLSVGDSSNEFYIETDTKKGVIHFP